jgi:gas vesicle protein
MESMNDSKFAWFVAGASIGATLALLFAPQSGEETRYLLREQAKKGRKRLAAVGEDLLDQGRDLYERAGDMVDEAAETIQERVDEGIARARSTFQS